MRFQIGKKKMRSNKGEEDEVSHSLSLGLESGTSDFTRILIEVFLLHPLENNLILV